MQSKGRLSAHFGFSLIELMVAVAIAGILAAVAVPSYSQYIARGKRTAVQGHMLSLSTRQEQYLLDNRQYTGTPANLIPLPSDLASDYSITIATQTAPPGYTITATPINGQRTRDTECGILTLDQAGTKAESGTGSVASCWK